jgi:hypothetical protein
MSEYEKNEEEVGFFKKHRCTLIGAAMMLIGVAAGYAAATYNESDDSSESSNSDESEVI